MSGYCELSSIALSDYQTYLREKYDGQKYCIGFFMYKNVWWVGLVPLTIVAVLDTMAYRGIKSLKKDYELALFREKQKEEKESENNK